MVKLFLSGEPLFMGILTLPILVIIYLASVSLHQITFSIPRFSAQKTRLALIKDLGLFALVFGVFSQFLGLYGALEAIEIWGNVEAKILFEGLKVSSIPLCYGLIIFFVSRFLVLKKVA